MRILIGVAAICALAACGEAEPSIDGTDEAAIPESEVEIGDDPLDSDTRFRETAWEWKANDGTIMLTSLDAAGSYRTVGGDELRDQGRWEVKDDHLCFDSEMLADELGCFKATEFRPLDQGETWRTINDDGEVADFTRRAYLPLAVEAPA